MEVLKYLIEFFTNYGYFAVFIVLVACGFGIPIPEDVTLIAGGVICAISADQNSSLQPHIMVVVAVAGVILGDGVMFFLGRKLGPRVTKVPLIKNFITAKTYSNIQEKAKRYGDKILFIARFLPGLRSTIFITAGVSHRVHWWKFLLMDGTAALISVPLLVYVGYFFAQDLPDVLKWTKHGETIVIGIVAIVILTILVINWLKKRKN